VILQRYNTYRLPQALSRLCGWRIYKSNLNIHSNLSIVYGNWKLFYDPSNKNQQQFQQQIVIQAIIKSPLAIFKFPSWCTQSVIKVSQVKKLRNACRAIRLNGIIRILDCHIYECTWDARHWWQICTISHGPGKSTHFYFTLICVTDPIVCVCDSRIFVPCIVVD